MPLNPEAHEFKSLNRYRKTNKNIINNIWKSGNRRKTNRAKTRRGNNNGANNSPRKSTKTMWRSLLKTLEEKKMNNRLNESDMNNYLREIKKEVNQTHANKNRNR